MKLSNSRTLVGVIMLLALLVGSNGCMTQSAVQYGRGHPEKAWVNNEFGYGGYSDPNLGYTDPPLKSEPQPGYYVLLPLTIPADVVTSPFQLIGLGFFDLIAHSSG